MASLILLTKMFLKMNFTRLFHFNKYCSLVSGGFVIGVILFVLKLRKNRARQQNVAGVSYQGSANVNNAVSRL